MSRTIWFTQRRRLLIAVIALASAMGTFAFQNCGGAPNSSLSQAASGQVNNALATKPNPVDLSINQISYMSCPTNNANLANPDPLGQAYYRLRFGAYDNSAANGFVGGANIAGMSLSAAGITYMKSISLTPNASMYANYISTSPYTAQAQPVAAMIYKSRSKTALTYNAMASPILTPFNDASVISTLANSGTSKISYIPQLGSNIGAFVGNLNQNTINENQLRINLNSQLLFIGRSPTSTVNDATSITQNLIGPDNDATLRLYGTGYNLAFNNHMMTAINEFSLETSKSGTGIAPNGTWDCFSLSIVREADRTYSTVNTATSYSSTIKGAGAPAISLLANDVIYPGEENLIPGNIVQTKNYFTNATSVTNVVNNLNAKYAAPGGSIPKTAQYYAACPTENSQGLTGINADRYRIARRFLTSANWEINMASGCAVPTSNVSGSGETCYTNDTGYGQVVDYTGTPGVNCRIDPTDATKQDCAAKVSFCWKK
jgi:hypothetical protein